MSLWYRFEIQVGLDLLKFGVILISRLYFDFNTKGGYIFHTTKQQHKIQVSLEFLSSIPCELLDRSSL